jgi:LPS sulfotransferase NodH
MIYVILSPGRTGSTFLLNAMSCSVEAGAGGICNAVGYHYPYELDKIKSHNPLCNMVIHSHKLSVITDLGLEPSEVTVVLSRRSIFESVMSRFVAELTGEWSSKMYTNRSTTPQHINIDAFKKQYEQIRVFYKTSTFMCNFLKFKEVIVIDYENMEFNKKFVATALGINNTEDDTVLEKPSPHNYRDWISNWAELQTTCEDFVGG